MRKLVNIKDAINKIAKKTGLDVRIRESRILTEWGGIVGTEISLHTSPVKIFKGKLFVKVDSSAWMAQLTFIKRDIITKINKHIGTKLLRDIFFSIHEKI